LRESLQTLENSFSLKFDNDSTRIEELNNELQDVNNSLNNVKE